MDLIASCAWSMVTISMNSVVCGSKSWFTISILEFPDVRMDVNPVMVVRRRRELEAPLSSNFARVVAEGAFSHVNGVAPSTPYCFLTRLDPHVLNSQLK